MRTVGKQSELWRFIIESDRIVLTTHVRPDGDGIASEIALYSILKDIGKDVYIVNQDTTPEMYAWLPMSRQIHSLTQHGSITLDPIDLSLLLDCSSRDRIGEVYEIIKGSRRIISLDHHEGNDCFRDYCFIDTTASSIGELLHTVVPDIEKRLDRDLATCLYVSIMTDTGSFAYSNTTGNVFRIVSKLIEQGLDPDRIYKNIYNRKRINHFRLLGKALQLMETDESGKIVSVLLPRWVYDETGANEEDNEGILEVIRGLRDMELIILLRQIDDRKLKCSLRSINSIDCNHLARRFNGGGHFKAAGFVLEGEIESMGREIVDKIVKEVKEYGWL
jgi:phosphoesterase RecJ-like protein